MKPLDLSPDAPWRQRYRTPVVAGSQVAHSDKSRGLAISNRDGVYQLYAWHVDSGDLRQITNAPAGVVFGGLSPDGKYIYYLRDEKGNELGHFVRVPFEAAVDTVPEDLTPDMPPYASFSISQSLNGAKLGFSTGGNDGFTLWVMDVAPDGSLSAPAALYKSARLTFGPTLSANGEWALVTSAERSEKMNYSVYSLRTSAPGEIVHVLQDDDASIQPLGFAPVQGDTRVLATTNVTGFDRPVIWDAATGLREDFPLNDLEGDVSPVAWSPDGKRFMLNQMVGAHYQLYEYDLDRSTLTKLNHPGGSYYAGYYFDDETFYTSKTDAQNPTQVIALNPRTGALKHVVLKAGDAPASRPMRSVTFPSTDGATIQAWIATPDGDGPWPTILETHGGPTAVKTDSYSAFMQAWLDHGYAFCSVNYRGSVSFGRQFEQAIWGNLGDLEVDDMAAAYQWLVANGIAQPDTVLLTGGSYGGYLTLQGLGRRPELWAGGMAVVAIADWTLMYEDQAETLRGYQRSLFGGTPDELPEQHAKSSPITYAGQIRAPVLVIQGSNDTRCPARQMRMYEDKLKSLGKEITVDWFDAGHGSRAMEESIRQTELMLRWANRVLG